MIGEDAFCAIFKDMPRQNRKEGFVLKIVSIYYGQNILAII